MSDRITSALRREAVAANVIAPSKSALTKSAILDAAKQFLETHDFRDLTVGTLMSNAGYSRATFYQYFNDLHGLMAALLDGVKGGIVEGAHAWLSGEGDPASSLQRSLTALVDVGAEQGFILKAVADAAANDDRLEQIWEAFLEAFDQLVAARIAEDQASGITPEFDPYPVAHALNRMDASVLISSFGQSRKTNKQDVLSGILRIWLSTLYPSEAKKLLALEK
jgi:TetR/AcrR family transcriptional regulator, ethionamide resistance regulator